MKRYVIGALVIGVTVGVGVWYWRRGGEVGEGGVSARARVVVAVMPVIMSNCEMVVEATGNVEAWQEADIGAQVADNVRALYVEEGDIVTAGYVLAELDEEQARAMYEAAVAARKAGEAEVTLAETTYTNVATQFERTRKLYGEGVVGRQTYDDAETAMLLARGRLEVAQAQLRRVEATEDELLIRLRRYKVVAPFDGVVAKRYVDPGAFAGVGAPLVRLVQLKPIKVVVEVPEGRVEVVKAGQAVRVAVDAVGVVVTGRVTRVYPTLDARWRTRTVEIRCENEGGQLRPGMFARVEIVSGERAELLVADSAVLRLPGSGLWHVYVVRGGVAERVDVEVVRTLGGWRVVRGAIREGEEVVVKGGERLQSGMAVEVVGVEMLP
ncbi:MAG: efflux RND transporter periplasmic adaptor subunit [bacterium]|nr:efflux RND transporter periplasmic adaptor subunit [bacterium]